ncbi:DUF3617 domain-containing protein [Arenimonas donghaensis]|uniref:DUF3617 family protein n=1 Tax=Arenimonas donghaensis DSM 18148 = HO3-R19 TaxID=1121014 RepID=A0A087MKG0_9GAMM|nr:DUF3617 family protein [Arenimonas donghaensis]KFL37363.1 hypothetical protein N788_10205 [Arenimonas donghaensis DSM 18148 = HO3-R19]
MSKLPVLTLSTLVLALGTGAGALAQTQEGNLYRVTTQVELVGLPMQLPDQTTEVCGPKDHSSQKMVPHDEDCEVTRFEVEGGTSRYTLVCTGAANLTAKGEFEQLGDDAYRGKMHMVGTSAGQSMEMNMRFQGKRIGACEYTPPAAADVAGEAQNPG